MERLFDAGEEPRQRTSVPPSEAPLPQRARPRSLDELVGQDHLLAEGSPLRVAVETGEAHSAIFYGPPGSGKTTLARIIAAAARGAFEEESAVNAGRAEVRAVIERAEERRRGGQPTIFFLDEIHRFNKAQQDALLPAVEEGLLTLIGATTENPYFEVNSALLSRAQVYELRPLGPEEIRRLLDRALADPERGLDDPPEVEEPALELLAGRSDGDARVALSALERAVEIARVAGHAVDLETAEEALQRKALTYDREGDRHYDYISAWIKATRASDPDASLYYLAVMLEGGEDPRFIARRMVIFASEDVGNADPQALVVATSAAAAVDRVGLPECHLNLAQAATYLALAPKSNASYRGIRRASAHVREHGAQPPPSYLRDAHYPGAKKLGRGVGYVYPHDEAGGVAGQQVIPEGMEGERFYEPTDRGFEAELGRRLEELRRALGRPA
jgi:putative ATPase